MYEKASHEVFNHLQIVDNINMTGSCAEFYIVPGVPCVGDLDLMYYTPDKDVAWDGSAVDFKDVNETVDVLRIETLGCPTEYVHLRKLHTLHFKLVYRRV